MKRVLLKSTSFIRTAKRIVKRNPDHAHNIKLTLKLLEENAFNPILKTHKLKGALKGSWACSVAYDLRIVFEFVRHHDKNAILLEAIGTHNEVY